MTLRLSKLRTKSGWGRFFHHRHHATKNHCKVSPSEDLTEVPVASSLSHDDSSSTLSSLVPPPVEAKDTCAQEVTVTIDVTTDSTPKKKRQVSFGRVQVREYAVILGDHPDCPFPLSLGWEYQEDDSVRDVLEYDEQRQQERKNPTHKRSRAAATVAAASSETTPGFLDEQDDDDDDLQELSLYERRMRLRSCGYSESYLRQAERQRRIALALQFKPQDGGAFPFSYNYVTKYAWDRKPRALDKWIEADAIEEEQETAPAVPVTPQEQGPEDPPRSATADELSVASA